jgi:ureidoacrylate peracid hydrolase
MSEFPIVPSQTAMLFFDTLNVYYHPDGVGAPLAGEAAAVVPQLVRLNEACRRASIAIFYGQADHRPDRKDFASTIVQLGYDGQPGEAPRRSTPPKVAAGSWYADVIPEIAPQDGDYVIKKHRWSTFFQTHLELSLRTAGIDTIILAGGATHVGVASTAYSARDRDFNLIVLRDACNAGRPGINDFFMDRVFPVFARVMTVDQLLAQLEEDARAAKPA